MSSMLLRRSAITDEVPWPHTLYRRRGAHVRLCGITVFYDFRWTDLFPNGTTQFRNGKSLAQMVKSTAPEGKIPALLLTRRTDQREGWRQHDRFHLLVVNIDLYLSNSSSNAGATYLANLSPIDLVSASGLQGVALTTDQVHALLRENLDGNSLRNWIQADAARISILVDIFREHISDYEESHDSPGRDDDLVRELLRSISADIWRMLSDIGTDMPEALAYREIWKSRERDCAIFRTHLQNADWDEPDWQRFFEERIWIFGYGLRYQFLHSLQSRPYVGGKGLNRRGGQESDYLLATSADARFTVLVEIKTPQWDLVSKESYRNRTYGPGAELATGVAQVQQECWRWAVVESRLDEARDELERQHIWTHEPHGILVIGRLEQLRHERDRLRSFESFRRNLRLPEVLTFDELLSRAEQLVAAAGSRAAQA